MHFRELSLPGVHLIEPSPARDERGLFMRTFCQHEMAAHGLETTFVQCNLSVNEWKGTLRGLHYQAAPHGETKLLRCERGALHVVVLDLRPDSPSFKSWCAAVLRPHGAMLYVPQGCANGFQTLADDTAVHYQMSAFYHPASARGVRWNDPQFAIAWPPEPRRILSARDAELPDFTAEPPPPPLPLRKETP